MSGAEPETDMEQTLDNIRLTLNVAGVVVKGAVVLLRPTTSSWPLTTAPVARNRCTLFIF
jgi:hypothetical protein